MMQVRFRGGTAVEAFCHGHTVLTGQPEPYGSDSAMSPFDLFQASIATCMGFWVLRFCQGRGIPTTGLDLRLEPERDEERKRVARIRVELTAPDEFLAKYRAALLRAVDPCAVKKHLVEPPEFEIELVSSRELTVN